MFHIYDFWNIKEFIKKLNSIKKEDFFDGKYTSLVGVPMLFTPKKHTHQLVSEVEPGFISSDDYKKISCNTNIIPSIFEKEGYSWKGDCDNAPLNVVGYSALYCNKLGFDIKKWSSSNLGKGEGPYVHLFHKNIIYLDCNFFIEENAYHIESHTDFVLNFHLELTDVERHILSVGKQLEYYLGSLKNLPYIDIPLTIVFQNFGEWSGNVCLGNLILNDYRGDEDYCNTTSYSGNSEDKDFQNGRNDITEEECLKSDINKGNFWDLFISEYFLKENSLPIYSENIHYLAFRNQDFYQKSAGYYNKILISREAEYLNLRSVYIDGFLRLMPSDSRPEGCRFYSL